MSWVEEMFLALLEATQQNAPEHRFAFVDMRLRIVHEDDAVGVFRHGRPARLVAGHANTVHSYVCMQKSTHLHFENVHLVARDVPDLDIALALFQLQDPDTDHTNTFTTTPMA